MADSDSLVLGRAKRSTAGNRLRALLDKAHSVDAEQGFEEVADDKDFEDTREWGSGVCVCMFVWQL